MSILINHFETEFNNSIQLLNSVSLYLRSVAKATIKEYKYTLKLLH